MANPPSLINNQHIYYWFVGEGMTSL